MPEDPMHTNQRIASVSDFCLSQYVIIPPTKFREESIMLQHLHCSSCLNYVLGSQDKGIYSVKAGSGTGMGTAGSNGLFQSALARISSFCHVILTHLQNKHLQSYICFLRFVYQEKRNLRGKNSRYRSHCA